MWIVSAAGFISIVQHRSQPDLFLVRARVQDDLRQVLNLAGLVVEVSETPDADYRYRTMLSRAQVGALFSTLAGSIDYPNFKSAVAARGGSPSRLAAYQTVWHTLSDLQP